MKIRTDFVTNSSSSSYCVEIDISTEDGELYEMRFPEDDPDGMARANLNCTAKQISKVSSLDELFELLKQSADFGMDRFDDEDDEYEDPNEELFSRKCEEVKDNIGEFSKINAIEFRRIWEAWGEGASCFGWNLKYMAEELPALAQKVVDSEGEEKEKAKQELQAYLENNTDISIDSDWDGECPDGFMGSDAGCTIVWDEFVSTLEDFAKAVLSKSLPNRDYAISTTRIDMTRKRKNITHKAEYILR